VDLEEFADKFETVQEIFDRKRWELEWKGIPPRARRYILKVTEYFIQGVMTFEQLDKRTAAARQDQPLKPSSASGFLGHFPESTRPHLLTRI